VKRLAAALAVLFVALGAAPASAQPLTVMTFNVWYGGVQVDFSRIGAAIRRADADIVGVQEPEGNLRAIARSAGLPYVDESLHLISRYPLYAAQRGGIRFAYAALRTREVVAIANTHLPSSPYGPELQRDGKSRKAVLENERQTRLSAIKPYLGPLSSLSDAGVPTFLTGDFNSPSHLDEAFPWPVSRALAKSGFRDSYRQAFPDPLARPGLTWTAGTPPGRIRKKETLDRIDWVMARGPSTTLYSRLVGEQGGPDVDIGLERWGSDHRAVASTFDVDPAAAPPLVGTDQRVVNRGETLTIRYASHRGRRIGILPAHASRPIVTLPIYDASDHQAAFFGTRPLRPGMYRAALLNGHGGIEATSRFWILPRGAQPRIRSAKAVYRQGEPVRLSWRNAPGNKYDWVGVFPGGPLNVYNYLGFSYIGALPNGHLAMTQADLGKLAPGRYTAGLFLDDGYSVLARTSFRVVR
jgi:endonuclease/exonuclease/phosphatase family metal-dependent hydrolase